MDKLSRKETYLALSNLFNRLAELEPEAELEIVEGELECDGSCPGNELGDCYGQGWHKANAKFKLDNSTADDDFMGLSPQETLEKYLLSLFPNRAAVAYGTKRIISPLDWSELELKMYELLPEDFILTKKQERLRRMVKSIPGIKLTVEKIDGVTATVADLTNVT